MAGGLVVLGRRSRRPMRGAAITNFCDAAPLALLAVIAPTIELAAAAVVGSLRSAGFNVFWTATVQQHVRADAQARAFTYTMVGSYRAGPVAFAAAGPVASAVGAHLVLGVEAAWTIVAALVVVGRPASPTVPWCSVSQIP